MKENHAELAHKVFEGTYSDTLGLKIEEYYEGHCRGYLSVKKDFLNPMGVLHGGFMYIIADTVGGIAATPVGRGQGSTTVSGNISYLRAFSNLDKLYVEADVIKSDANLIFVEAMILSEDHTIYAKVNLTYATIPLPDNIKKL